MTAGHEVSTATGPTEFANGHRDLFAKHAEVTPCTTEGKSKSLTVDQYRPEAEPSIQASPDAKQQQLPSSRLKTSAYTPKPEQAHSAAQGMVADQDYGRPAYSGWRANTPNGVAAHRSPLSRRVATPETAQLRQHHDVAESTPDAAGRPADKTTPTEGISAFLSRLLNQLSLSAWLPAAMLVGSLAVLLQLRTQRNRNIVEAVTGLANRPLGLLVFLLFAILLATMITQAFEFEVIRLLEGYWGGSLIVSGIAHLFVSRQRRKFYSLLHRRDKLTLRAFNKTKLLENNIIPPSKKYIVDLIKGDLEGSENTLMTGWRAKKRVREAMSFDWRQFAPADLMGQLDAVETQIGEYPRLHRMLPTKLGNVLRAAEDSISHSQGEELEGFVIRNWEEMPDELRKEHDQYRTRLDLYCTLVFVFLVLAILAPPLITLGPRYLPSTVAKSFAYLVMSFVSHTAAVASARGYGVVLKAIAGHDNPVKARHRQWLQGLNARR